MKASPHHNSVIRQALSLLLVLQVGFSSPLQAASVALASAPLANSTTTTVLPNLMFLMDNSGSMSQDYTPDYMMEYDWRNSPWTSNGWNNPATVQKNCRDSADDDGSVTTTMSNLDLCVVGDVPYMTSSINSQYYNPAIRYLPGVFSDGASKPSQTDPTNVLLDGYGKHNQSQLGVAGTTIDLTTQYPDRVWCTKNNPTAAELSDSTVCRKNSDYLYPDATYKYGRDNDGTTANKNVLGVMGAPYYYQVVVSEYCKEAELRNCTQSSVATGEYVFPAKSRWCSDTALTTCQSTKTSTYKYPRYVGAASTIAVAASGIIRASNTAPRTIASIKVNGVEVLGASVTGTSQIDLASKVATQINTYVSDPEYSATTAVAFPYNDNTYVKITSTTAAGASANGTVAISGNGTVTSNVTGGVTGFTPAPYSFARTDIVPATTSYPKATSRTDCAGATCTYADEVTNFANWYAYYRTRMQSMKSSVSLAFRPIGSNYRVGFMNICKGSYLPVAPFDNSDSLIGAVAASGSFRFNSFSAGVMQTVSSIKVNGIEILGATVTSNVSRADLATNLAAQINSFVSSPEYTAVANSGGSNGLIKLSASINDGAGANGTIVVTGGPSLNSNAGVSGGVTGAGQKSKWYETLFDQTAAGCGTPLRSALATAGRIFAGKEMSSAGSISGSTIDPVQYSCQQNFTLLTTDGYWNGAGGTDLDGVAMGNQDGGTTPRPMFEGNTATGTLADVAKYYYDTDLRTSGFSNCTGSLGIDVCENNVFVSSTDNNLKQHMTTFTLGLGVDGTLSYVSDYKNATTGDFYNLKEGLGSPVVNWPVPAADNETAVDDLWHAAVNGQGTYFSAKDPAQLAYGLSTALNQIGSKVGATSAAATSTLNPVAGNNYAYVASYSSVKWTGNLEARTIDTGTGVVSETAAWCVQSISAGTCAPPSTVVQEDSGSSTVTYCVTGGATTCTDGILDGTNCKVQLPTSCVGTMNSKVDKSSDSRTIYKANASGALESFIYSNLDSSFFTGTGLSQWSVLTATQKTVAAGENLVNFLRGQTGYEDRTSNPVDNRLYRMREATMGDALESQPFFISKPVFSYADAGYAKYKTDNAARVGSVYMGTNDGMLHSFAADTGVERWAYVPTVVIPNLWKLADKNYSTGHTNYVNGSPVISDICTANCSCDDACVSGGGSAPVWKTILIGGLNAGGRSFYALDISNPVTPSLLWEVSSSSAGFANLGYSFGHPIITKKADGTWVVLLTSGYNNTSPGDGKGYLYVLNAGTGALISAIGTSVGDATTPSGLARVSAWNDYGGVNNTAGYVYGGDLLGNLWRFDINAESVIKFATLLDSSGQAQPVMTSPTLGLVSGQRVIFVGTGKYLEVSDLTNTDPQTIYAISDNNSGATLVNARSALVEQTLTRDGNARTASNNPVNFGSVRGWYVDLKDTSKSPSNVGERVNIDMKLVQGTLIAATIVPSNTVCSPGGYGWLNFFDYETGGFIEPNSQVSTYYSSPIVGVNVLYIQGKPVVEVVTANKPTPTIDPNVKIKGKGSNFAGKRVMWRELVQ
ncbi:MAG: putative Tfp pilus assembly protein tip-associated adhesin PilY1 [Proteobacteria bacterium]|nr:putative Tfp pilus assembly protein tip-associated adhesin PilY1 [Pseudomonadota bacterium]